MSVRHQNLGETQKYTRQRRSTAQRIPPLAHLQRHRVHLGQLAQVQVLVKAENLEGDVGLVRARLQDFHQVFVIDRRL